MESQRVVAFKTADAQVRILVFVFVKLLAADGTDLPVKIVVSRPCVLRRDVSGGSENVVAFCIRAAAALLVGSMSFLGAGGGLFGDADETQLEELARLTNARVFDGRENLTEAFRSVKGYN